MRHRLFTIYHLAINKIHQFRMFALALYTKLDEWIIYSLKAENDYTYAHINKIRGLIQVKLPISNIHKMDFWSISSTHGILNHEELPVTSLKTL